MTALTVHNAEIKTATVEVKTLTISGKQVTLAVFRQLREQELVAYDGNLNGAPWGTVNYHPDKCADGRDHLHVVWQQGAQLHRCKVERRDWWRTEPFWPDSMITDEFYQLAYCLNGHKRPDWAEYKRLPGEDGASPIFTVDRIQCSANLPVSDRGTYGHYQHQKDHACGDPPAYDKALAELQLEVAAERERRARIDARWRELNDLPQLFIAV